MVVANLPVSYSVETTYDADTGIAWVVGPDDETGRLTVTRVEVTPTSLAEQATWSTDGWLVDARRVGDRLHVVAADGYGDGVIPFESRPVPCDEVLHPPGESDATATLLVTLPATGPLDPEHATEVVGSGPAGPRHDRRRLPRHPALRRDDRPHQHPPLRARTTSP